MITQFKLNFHNYKNGTDQELRQIFSPVLSIADERDDPENITLEDMRKYDAVLFYCAGTWGISGDSDFLVDLITYVASGGCVMILHVNCLGQSGEGGAVFGGRFCMHPPYDEYHIIPAERDGDPILQGVSDFYIYDEMHMLYADVFLKKDVLLYCACVDKTPGGNGGPAANESARGPIPHQDIYGKKGGLRVPVAWRYVYGEGKILYVLPGHNTQSYKEPNLRRFLRNGAEWLLARE